MQFDKNVVVQLGLNVIDIPQYGNTIHMTYKYNIVQHMAKLSMR